MIESVNLVESFYGMKEFKMLEDFYDILREASNVHGQISCQIFRVIEESFKSELTRVIE